MNKILSWILFVLSIASLWIVLVIVDSGYFSTADIVRTLLNFMGLLFFSILFVVLLLILWKRNFFKRKN